MRGEALQPIGRIRPTLQSIDLESCRREAIAAAIKAWDVIAPFHKGSYGIYQKAGEGPATDADIAADRAILDHLQAQFPAAQFGYLTEETEKDDERLRHRYCWIIDPIDGTREFIEGRDDFAVHIGLAGPASPDGPIVALVGVVYMPKAGILYHAVKGQGAFARDMVTGNDRRLEVSSTDKLGDARLVVTRAADALGPQRRLTRAVARLGVRDVYTLGSLGVKVAEVVEGRADFYMNASHKSCKEWDVCAPAIVLEEAGGRISQVAGDPILYNKVDYYVHHGLIASNGVLHERIVKSLDGIFDA